MQSNLSFFLGSFDNEAGHILKFFSLDEMITEILGEPTSNQ